MAPPCVNQQGFSPFVIHRVPSPPSSSLSLFFIKPAIENRDWTDDSENGSRIGSRAVCETDEILSSSKSGKSVSL